MATSDEQRAAFEAWFRSKVGASHEDLRNRHEYGYASDEIQRQWRAWQACAAQQALQERADERPLPKVNIAIVYRFLGTEKRAAIYSTSWKDGIDINMPAYGLQALVEFYVAQDRMRALAANPQESTAADAHRGHAEFLRVLASSPSQPAADGQALLREAAANVPITWLDPLLTGPTAVIGQLPCDGPAIERLLDGVRQRILDMMKSRAAAPALGEGER